MTTNNEDMVNNKTNNKHTFVNDNTDTSDIISNNKTDIVENNNNTNNTQEDNNINDTLEAINEEEAVKQILREDRSAYDNFLDYDRRAKEGEFLLNQYFNNPRLTTLCKYLWFNCAATCTYLYRYRTISNLLYEQKSNKTILTTKHVVYITYAIVKMLLVSFTLFTMRLAISLVKLIFCIFELLSSFFTCMFCPKDIELILRKFRKRLEANSNNNFDSKSDTKVNRYWINLKDYWRYIFAKMTGKINTSKRIVKPTLNLALLKHKKISFMKKALIRFKHWTKLKMFNLRLINIIDNSKNKIRKRNAKNQMKYVRKVLDDYRKNRNTKKSKTKLQIKRKNKNSLKNTRRQIRGTNKSKNIKDKLIQKINELAIKTKKLEFLGENILLNNLLIKITKSLAREKDLQTNLTIFQKIQYDKYSKVEEEKTNTKENEIKNKKENLKENSKEKENNQKDKINKQNEVNNEIKNKMEKNRIENNSKNGSTIKKNVKFVSLKGVRDKNEKRDENTKSTEQSNEKNEKFENLPKEEVGQLLDTWNNNINSIKEQSFDLDEDMEFNRTFDIFNNTVEFETPTQTSQINQQQELKHDNNNQVDNNSISQNSENNNNLNMTNSLKHIKNTDNNNPENNDPKNKNDVKKEPNKDKGGPSI